MPITNGGITGGNGIPFTKTVDGPADYANLPNNTYFKDMTDDIIYFKNVSGVVVESYPEPAGSGLTMTGDLVAAVGAVGGPSIHFGDVTTGLFRDAIDSVGVTASGAQVANFSSAGLTMNNQIMSIDGTVGVPGVSFDSDPDTGLYRIGANKMGFSANGDLSLSIDDTSVTVEADTNLVLMEPSASGTNKVTVVVPAIVADYALTLPVDAGTDGGRLRSDGTGALEWSPIPTYVKTGTYFENTGLTSLTISGMTITPPAAGTYKVNFNTQFNTTLANVNAQAKIDLNALHTHLTSMPLVGGAISTFATGSTIFPGVYTTVAALTPTGSITFDAGSDPNAIFVIQTGGALTIAASSTFSLIGGATASMIYWVATGAITIGTLSSVHGTFVGSADVTVGLNCNLIGRATTRSGLIISTGNVQVSPHDCPCIMGLIRNFALYTGSGAITNSAPIVIVGDIGSFVGAITGFAGVATISGYIYDPIQGSSLVSISLYVDTVIQPISTRERTNSINREDIVIEDILTITAGQTISVECVNNVGISRFYNRILIVEKI